MAHTLYVPKTYNPYIAEIISFNKHLNVHFTKLKTHKIFIAILERDICCWLILCRYHI